MFLCTWDVMTSGLKNELVPLALLDDRWRLGDVLSENVSFDEVREPHGQLMRNKLFRGD